MADKTGAIVCYEEPLSELVVLRINTSGSCGLKRGARDKL